MQICKGLCRACYSREYWKDYVRPPKKPRQRFNGISAPELPDINLPPKKEGILTIEDLTRVVGDYADIPYANARRAVLAIFGKLIKEIAEKREAFVDKFGKFTFIERGPSKRWNIALKTVTTSNTSNTVRFKPHIVLDYMVNPESYEPNDN